jgi:hypothetical protein
VAGGNALPPLVLRQIAERSEGVPLFVEEVTKAALESGALRLEAKGYELSGNVGEHPIPSTVQASLLARFDRLGESRSLAQLGAAIGREFTYPLIRALAEISDEQLREHLDRFCRSELAFVRGEPPAATYTFKHALIQDAIYGTLLKKDRARVHERIFVKLRDHFPDIIEARPEMAAYHAENAGLRALALPLLKEAGMRAFGRTAMVEAVKHLSHAIDLVDALAEKERVDTEIELEAILGPTYMATRGWAAPEVERSCERLRDLATSRGDAPRLYQAMWGLWTVHFLRGQMDPALEVGRQVLEMALQSGDPMLAVTGHHAVGYTHLRRGEYAEAIRHADEGIANFDIERERRILAVFQFSSTCALWWFRGQAQLALGQMRNASESIERARTLVDELRHAPSRAFLLSQQCISLSADDVEEVDALAREMRSLSIAEGFALWVPYADIFLAWTDARRGGDPAAAAETIKTATRAVHDGLCHIQDPEFAGMLAQTLLLATRPQDVFPVAEVTLQTARNGGQLHLEAELLRVQGDAAAAMGDKVRAATFYRQGVERARSKGGQLLQLRSTLALARLLGGAEERAELKDNLAKFPAGSDQAEVRQASALLTT